MTHTDDPADFTLDELRVRIAPALGRHAGFDGWTADAVDSAAREHGVDAGIARLAFPGGPADLVDAWFESVDRDMLADLPPERLAAMRIRDRVTALVEARLAILAPNRDALRRALAILATPGNAAHAARLGWRAADAMWRAAGDRAVDLNHYSKRTILGGVYGATLLAFVADDGPDYRDTRAFLARRIDGIMRFEKAKAQFRTDPDRHFNVARFLGRLRYQAANR